MPALENAIDVILDVWSFRVVASSSVILGSLFTGNTLTSPTHVPVAWNDKSFVDSFEI